MRDGGVLCGVLAALAMSGVVLAHKCERISIPMCQELGYNLTVMPNFVGHEDQLQAERGVTNLPYTILELITEWNGTGSPLKPYIIYFMFQPHSVINSTLVYNLCIFIKSFGLYQILGST